MTTPRRLAALEGRKIALVGARSALGEAVVRALEAELDEDRPFVVELGEAGPEPPNVDGALFLPRLSTEPPLDEALERGPEQAAALARWAEAGFSGPVVLASATEVIGQREGLALERDVLEPPCPKSAPRRGAGPGWTVDGELGATRALIERARARARQADVLSKIQAEAQSELAADHQPSSGTALEEERAEREATFLRATLVEEGRERAHGWGFLSTRGWALALTEQSLATGALGERTTTVRLAPLGPALDDTLVPEECAASGWIARARKWGLARLPRDAVCDVLPLDLAARALLLALVERLEEPAGRPGRRGKLVYASLGESAPKGDRVEELVDLYLRRASPSNEVREVARAAPPRRRGPERFAAKATWRLGVKLLQSSLQQGAAMLSDQAASRSASERTPLHAELRPASTRIRSRELRLLARRLAGPDDDLYRPDLVDVRRYFLDRLLPAADETPAPAEAARRRRRAHDSLIHLLEEAAERHGPRPALSMYVGDERTDVSYRELLARAGAVATRLAAHGVKPGDRVLLSGKNDPAWPIAAFGALGRGARLVPVDPALSPEQLAHVVDKAQPAAVVVDKEARACFGDALGEPPLDLQLTATAGPADEGAWARPGPDDVASVLFTSGTTGDPKGVMLTHGNFMALIASLGEVFESSGDDRALSVLPLHHTLEFSCGLLLPLAAGAQIFYVEELTGERVLHTLREGRITGMVGVPAVWQLLDRRIRGQVKERGERAEAFFDLAVRLNRKLGEAFGVDVGRYLFRSVHQELGGNLRLLISGGAALPSEVHGLFQGLGLHLAEGYGLTETAPVLTVAEGAPGAPSGTVGRPIPGVEVKLGPVDEQGVGEVLAKGPNVMLGYFENEAATEAAFDEEGWLKTGDLGRLDEDGRLLIVGRAKEVVVTASGENIYLDDVEDQLGAVPGVEELTLVGLDDPRGGERLACAFVGDAEVSAVKAAFKRLPAVFRPAVIERVEGPLPRTATRKIKRKEVRAVVEQALSERERSGAEQSAPRASDEAPASAPVRSAVALVAGVDPGALRASTDLADELGFDSLLWVELAAALEPLVGRLDPDALYACETVGQLESLVVEGGAALGPPSTTAPAPDEERVHVPGVIKAPARRALGMAQRDLYRTLFSTRVEGRSHIPHNRAAIVVANHSSHLDTGLVKFALGRYGERLRPLAAKDYFFEGNPWKVAFFEHLTNLVPLDRQSGSGAAFEQARELVEQGEIVLIYPEGTRGTTGRLADFKPLVGRLALLTGAPVLPLYLDGAFSALPKGAALPRQRRLGVRIGPVCEAANLERLSAGLPPPERARRATALIREAVLALGEGRALELAQLDEERARRRLLEASRSE